MTDQKINIPKEYIELAQSPEIYEACEKIGDKFGLQLDQIGELDAEIADILVGSSESKNFTSNIQERLEIDHSLAEKITQEVSTGILQTLKDKLKKIQQSQPQLQPQPQFEQQSQPQLQPQPQFEQQSQPQTQTQPQSRPKPVVSTDNFQEKPNLSPLEKAGRFNIEKEKTNASGNLGTIGKTVTAADRDNILSGIENPTSNIPTPKQREVFTEPLADHLLNTSTARPEEKIIRKEVPPPTSAPVNLPTGEEVKNVPKPPIQQIPPKPRGPDMYREPIS